MDELVIAVNKMAESLQNSTPVWISAVSIIVPIVLTIVSIVLSVRTDRNNKELQKGKIIFGGYGILLRQLCPGIGTCL